MVRIVVESGRPDGGWWRVVPSFLSGAFVAFAVAAGLVTTAPATAQSVVLRGKALIEGQCARCHAIAEEGTSPLEKAPPFRDLHRKYPIDALAEALAEGIVTGHSAMPEFKFSPADIDAILAYIKSISK